MATSNVFFSVGRRKESVARVRVMSGNSPIIVNDVPINELFTGVVAQKNYQKPLELTGVLGKFTATVRVKGGGKSSQLGATIFGISKALALMSAENRAILKTNGFLTRDARVRERRKYGLAHSARSKKQSPKR